MLLFTMVPCWNWLPVGEPLRRIANKNKTLRIICPVLSCLVLPREFVELSTNPITVKSQSKHRHPISVISRSQGCHPGTVVGQTSWLSQIKSMVYYPWGITMEAISHSLGFTWSFTFWATLCTCESSRNIQHELDIESRPIHPLSHMKYIPQLRAYHIFQSN